MSSDRDVSSFNAYFSSLPSFHAVPFNDKSTLLSLKSSYNVAGIPALLLLSPLDGSLMTSAGRTHVLDDPTGKSFPWLPSSSNSSSSSSVRLRLLSLLVVLVAAALVLLGSGNPHVVALLPTSVRSRLDPQAFAGALARVPEPPGGGSGTTTTTTTREAVAAYVAAQKTTKKNKKKEEGSGGNVVGSDSPPPPPLPYSAASSAAAAGAYDLTTAELRSYDGRDSSLPLLLSLGGIIFDVSSGASFYGVGSPYNVFAGRVATRALSVGSMSPEDMTDDVTGVPPEAVSGQIEFYTNKYKPVGRLTDYKPPGGLTPPADESSSSEKKEYDAATDDRVYYLSSSDLQKYDGRDTSLPLLLSVGKRIFDVSAGKQFYGVGMPYHVFAGRACTRALSIGSMEEKDMNDDVTGVEEGSVNEQVKFYTDKYRLCGILLPE